VKERERMVREQLVARGVKDGRVLAAMGKVPREAFLDAASADKAYEDRPLTIGHGQTISQPFVVARMAELARLQPRDRVLEIGAGCGYGTAVLAELAGEVWGIEIVPELASRARLRLGALQIPNATVEAFDGGVGWPARAPFDAVVVWASASRVPVLLLDQLVDGGRLVMPVGERDEQRLVVVTRVGDDFPTVEDIPVRFVDLTGRYGRGGSGAPQA
jgi:protein-L-isoaspartate(D-aspartate) O-methyltransferase